jgi:hypothetical protein
MYRFLSRTAARWRFEANTTGPRVGGQSGRVEDARMGEMLYWTSPDGDLRVFSYSWETRPGGLLRLAWVLSACDRLS